MSHVTVVLTKQDNVTSKKEKKYSSFLLKIDILLLESYLVCDMWWLMLANMTCS